MTNHNRNQPLRISVDEANRRTEKGDPTILDVDDPGSFDRRQKVIEGARRIDPRDIEGRSNQLPKDQAVLTYCT